MQGLVERAPRHAQRGGSHRGAEHVQRAHRDLEALPGLADALRQRDAAIVELQACERVRRDDIDARIKGLDSGADDYVVKPVDLFELGARLRSLIRRAHGHIDDQLVVEGVTLTVAARSVAFQGRAVSLSSREFDLLHALMSSAGRVLTRAQLEQRIYGWGQEVESNAVEYHIHNLRKKLSTELIETIRGVGYMIARRSPNQSVAAK